MPGVDVGQVTAAAFNALFQRPWVGALQEHVRIMVGFDDHQIAIFQMFFHHGCGNAQIGGDTDFGAVLLNGKSGRVLSVNPPSLLEQVWDFGDQEEASIVRIELFDESGKTRLELSHINIPDEAFENIEEGWSKYYLGALKSYLEH